MKTLIKLTTITIVVLFSQVARADTAYDSIFYSPGNNNILYRPPASNLGGYFGIFKVNFIDSSSIDSIENQFAKTINKIFPEIKGPKIDICEIFKLEDHPDLFFYVTRCSADYHVPCNFVYSRSQNTIYFLNAIDIRELNLLLSTEKFDVEGDEGLLRYAFLVEMLKRSISFVKIISSAEDLLLTAIMHNPPSFFMLKDLKTYNNLPIEFPSIVNTAEGTLVTFCIAVDDTSIEKIKILFDGIKIKSIDEIKIGKGIRW
jgi:hypothetical protein